jgi:hypothetical protein
MEDHDPSTDAMVDHLARRLVDRYGRDAPEEAGQIVTLLTEDGNVEQAQVWTRVMEACRRMVTKPGQLTRKE